MKVTICDDIFEIAKTASAEVLSRSRAALSNHKRCNVALSGGSTPKHLFAQLVDDAGRDEEILKILQNINWFFSDERFVPHSDANSNYKLADDCLFSKLDIDEQSIFTVPTQNISQEQAAQNYEATIKSVVGGSDIEVPVFDLIFLGMGDDGHTASLFPNTLLVDRLVDNPMAAKTLVETVWVQKNHTYRVTFTPQLINHANAVMIMVSGEQKAKTLENVLLGTADPKRFPVQLIKPIKGDLSWLVDKAAAPIAAMFD